MRRLILFLCSLSAFGACASSWTNGYVFCREIVIDHTKVTADQTNFPVAICIGSGAGANCSTNQKELAVESVGGRLVNANGYDFIVTSDNAGTTGIPYERAYQNISTGDAELWVKIASLSSSVDTKIYLFYRNSGITTDQSNPTAVWDSSYLAVYHFPLTSGDYALTNDSLPDSKAAYNMGAATSNMIAGTAGVLGGGADFAAAPPAGFSLNPLVMMSDYTGLPTGSNPRMLEIWEQTVSPSTDQTAFAIGSNNTDERYALYIYGTGSTWTIEGTNVAVSFPGGTTAGWHYIAAGLPSGQTTFINSVAYVDGVSQTLTNVANGTDTVSTNYASYTFGSAYKIGDRAAAFTAPYLGKLDEARLSNTVRSSSWISTTYNSISNPATFYSLGSENGNLPSGNGVGARPVIFR